MQRFAFWWLAIPEGDHFVAAAAQKPAAEVQSLGGREAPQRLACGGLR